MKRARTILTYIAVAALVIIGFFIISLAADHVMEGLRKESFVETNIVQKTNNGYIDLYVDTETNVVYVRAVNGTLTAMVNSDGTPKLWTEKEVR